MLCFCPFPDSPQRNNDSTSKTYQGTYAKFDQYNRHSYPGVGTEGRGTYHHQPVAKLNQLYSNISISNSDSDKRAFSVPPELQDSLSEQRLPIMNCNDFGQYQKLILFTTGRIYQNKVGLSLSLNAILKTRIFQRVSTYVLM
jgi:hypothetical protein